jgi:hypothetical protein
MQVLKDTCSIASFHTMAFGVLSPWETSTKPINFGELDRRVNQAESAGQDIIITVGMTPSWMWDIANDGRTIWSGNNPFKAPKPENFPRMAEFSGQMAARYKGRVMGYQLWNEFKGFWSVAQHRWRHEEITDLYNQVYLAVKKADPAALMGGPYAPLRLWEDKQAVPAAIDYWLKHNVGHDFFCLDGHSQELDKITEWLRARGVKAPIIWSEFYAGKDVTHETVPILAAAHCQLAVNMMKGIEAGVMSALIWRPEYNANKVFKELGIWDVQGNPTPLAPLMTSIRDNFTPGTKLYAHKSSADRVRALAGDKGTLVVDRSGVAQSVAVDRKRVELGAWGWAFVPR